ncbi:MAG: hypothetical protein COU81_00720 [Candidatus Portnoybacteria bacterium CG10_big_fil_rev_8_21_14_0_10_36_7]|uniref:Carbohydrate kinase PfkB domain-containing protein n=1 Tax=Candidatus Portnoybacteria bacterium CG10_big_fil_rev_8_21_14_0_10_36_7 TaxID=1974812 RepID=A0A2M8KES7_9BACT|nr:MAG: hypothetical protein COU81_00720 [Candidatus Portnoybacteria bacterium CG10_big_fil_rev_8_21_14_0_10_36_7]
MENKIDFLGIGDIVTDAFIQLKDAEIESDGFTHEKKICMNFGDKISYQDVTVIAGVGNSANAAVCTSRLGLNSALYSDVGDDYQGNECVKAMESDNVATQFIKVHEGRKTNYHYVLVFKGERTILIKHENFDYVLPEIGSPKWVYLSSLGAHSLPFHKTLENYFIAHPEINVVFQPGSYQMKFNKEDLAGIYKQLKIFFCNKEEAQRILKIQEIDIKKLLSAISELGPKIVVITDGVDGAYAYDGKDFWHMPIYPDPKPPIDRTGAGDSFSATFTTAIALGMSIEDALRWGPINSMSVVQQVGARAGLLTRAQIEDYLAKAPEYYKLQKI